MKKKWLLYGANGYTGQLIAKEAKRRGLQPVLAGRNKEGIVAIAAETGFDSLVFDLDDTAALNKPPGLSPPLVKFMVSDSK